MAVAVPVVAHGGLLGDGFGIIQGNMDGAVAVVAGGEQYLHGVHSLAEIAAAGCSHMLPGPLLGGAGDAIPLFQIRFGPLDRLQSPLGGDGLELKNRGPAQNGIINVEIGVFRGGGNEGDIAVFDVLQQGLLLLLIKILNLIEIEQNAVGGHHGTQLGHNVPDILGGSRGGIEFAQFSFRAVGDDIGHGGFAHAGRSVENQIGDAAGFNNPAQHGPRGQNMVLTEDVLQRLGPDGVGQGSIHKNHLL